MMIVKPRGSSAAGTPVPVAKGAMRPDSGRDVVRWIAHKDGEPETDSPKSVHPAIRELLRQTVDADLWMGPEHRSIHCEKLIESARGTVASDPRVLVFGMVDYAVRVAWPTCLEVAGQIASADSFRLVEDIATVDQVEELLKWLGVEMLGVRSAYGEAKKLVCKEGEEAWVAAQAVQYNAIRLLNVVEASCTAADAISTISEGRIVHAMNEADKSLQDGLHGQWLLGHLSPELHRMSEAFLSARRAAVKVRSGQILVRAGEQFRLLLEGVKAALGGESHESRTDAQVRIATRMVGILRAAVGLRDIHLAEKGRAPLLLGEQWAAYLDHMCRRAKRVSPHTPAANDQRAPSKAPSMSSHEH